MKRGDYIQWVDETSSSPYAQFYRLKFLRLTGYSIQKLRKDLEKMQKSYSKNDYLKLEMFVELAYLYLIEKNANKFHQILSKILKDYDNTPDALLRVYYLKGIESFRNGKIKDAENNFLKAAQIDTDPLYQGRALNNLGIIYQEINSERSLHYFFQAKKRFEEIGNKDLVIKVQENIATIMKMMGKYSEAIDLLKYSVEYHEQNRQMADLAQTYHTLGVIYEKMGYLDVALGYFENGLKIREGLDDLLAVAWTYMKLGKLYLSIGELTKAIEYAQKSLIIRETNGKNPEIAQSLQLMAMIYEKLNDYTNAKSCLKRALNLYLETPLVEQISEIIFQLANLFVSEENTSELSNLIEIHANLHDLSNSPVISLRQLYLEGLLLKMSERPKEKFEAMDKFEEIIKYPNLDYLLLLETTKHLAELYIMELQISQVESVLKKLEDILSNMLEHSLENHSYLEYIHFLVLNAKLKSIMLNSEEALHMLDEAKYLCEEKGLFQFYNLIDREKEIIEEELSQIWEKINVTNPNLIERIKRQSLITYLDQVSQMIKTIE